MEYLKKAIKTPATDEGETRRIVEDILIDIEKNGEDAVRKYALKFDDWAGDFVMSQAEIKEKTDSVSPRVMDDLKFAYDQVYGFAVRQRDSMQAFETELYPGVVLGQKLIPCNCAGCYAPGGRYSHAASAIMSIATARAAEVPYVTAVSPSHAGRGIDPVVVAAMAICNPDVIMTMGGVQAVASLAFGLFTGKPADIIVGPGNRFVAEAKRILFGQIGIDVFAGPSESLVIADGSADPLVVSVDMMSQAEHGFDSPVWLVTDSRELGEKVIDLLPQIIKTLPDSDVALASWRDFGEVVLCSNREEMVEVSDEYAPEHLQVQAEDLDYWLENLTSYGSLFLGEGATVTYGDKTSGTNHILPTKKAARYSGGLSVHKFIKTVTYQKVSREANLQIGAAASRISRLEGMEGHARAADVRLRKYFPEQEFDFTVFSNEDYFKE